MRKTKTLLMMAMALLFSGAAFAASDVTLVLGQEGESLELTDNGSRKMGIYQQLTVKFSQSFINQYKDQDKVITVSYGEAGQNPSDREYKDKFEFLVEENANKPLVTFVLDYLHPLTEYWYEVKVTVNGSTVYDYEDDFTSYLGDLAVPQQITVVALTTVNQKATVTVSNLKNLETISGEKIVLSEATYSTKLTNERLAEDKDLATNVNPAADRSDEFEDEAGTFLVYGDPIVATFELTYNGKTLTQTANQNFGSDKMNPLWVYVVPAQSGTEGHYDIVVKGMPHPVTVTSCDIQVQTKKVDEDAWGEVYGVSRAIQADEEQFRVLDTELMVKDADVFNYPEEGFDFRLVIGFWVAGEHYEFTLDNAHASFDPYAYAFNFVPRWNNGNPTLESANINKTLQGKVKELVNSLITDGYWDGKDEYDAVYPEDIAYGAKVADSYIGNDKATQKPANTLANVSIALPTTLDPAEGLTAADSVWVEWEYFVIYEKYKNHNFYPEVIAIEPHIYEQSFDGAIFEDWAYAPEVGSDSEYLQVKAVRVFVDEKYGDMVEVLRPCYFQNGERMKTITIKVEMRDPSQGTNAKFVEVGSTKITLDKNKTNKYYTNRVKVNASDVIKKDFDNYCEVRVTVYGNDYTEYTAVTTDVFSAPNRGGVATVTELQQPVSFTLQQLNVDPILKLTGFKGEYKIYGTLQKLEANEDGSLKLVDGEPVPVGEPMVAPEVYRDKDFLGLAEVTTGLNETVPYNEEGFLFPNVEQETWYQANIEFEYAAIRDIIDPQTGEVIPDTVWMKGQVKFADGVNNPFKTEKVPAAGDIVVRGPRYKITETPGQIIARLRFLTGDDDDELYVKIPGFNGGKPYKADGTEEVEDPVWDSENHKWITEKHTLKTVELLLTVDLDVTTRDIPARWDIPYSAYIQDGSYQTAYENIALSDLRAVHTPVPYARYYTAAPWLYISKEDLAKYYELEDKLYYAPGRRAPLTPDVPEDDTDYWDAYDMFMYKLNSQCYVIKSAWEVADWAKATLFNTFAYSRADVPGFENASDPQYFGAPNLVYRAGTEDWMAELLWEDTEIESIPHGGPGLPLTDLDYDGHFDVPGYGIFVKDLPWLEEGEGELVTILPLDEDKAARVMDKYVLDEYLRAVGFNEYFFAGFFPYAFDVQLGDADLDATPEEMHQYYNEIFFTAQKATYTGKFDKSDRSVVIPFDGTAWEDEACETPATVRYFSAGYLTDDNKATYKFSKKMRNGKPSNELTSGYPYLVWSDSGTSEFDVYFTGENVTMRRNSEDSYSGGLNEVVVDLKSSWGQTLTEGMMIGSYRYVPDYELWSAVGAEYFETMTEEDLAEMNFWERLFYDYYYEQYNQIEICRYSSYMGNPVKLDRTLLAEYDKDDKHHLNLLHPEKHSGIVPFHCALIFAGANSGNTGYSISIRFDDDDATLIEDVMAVESVNTDMFDVMGRKITEPVKGQIYIQNGKKFIVK